MKVTVDANILFSALLKDGATRRVWFNPGLELFAPAFLLSEFYKYKSYLTKKFSGSGEEFEELLGKLIVQARFVADEELVPFLPAASSLTNDEKDWLYVACALCKNTVIWSNDKGFRNQRRVEVFSTEELIKKTGSL